MAEIAGFNAQASLLHLLRQAGVLIGLTASIALGLYVALWARTPEYSMLYTELSERDLSQVVEALQSNNIPYRMEGKSGAILVAADKVDDARLKLASAGLPHSAGLGFEAMQEEQGFGTSQFVEQARYQHAIEGELSRSISHITSVRAARVHLALPRQSAFARSKSSPTASVIIDLYNGHQLEPHQVGAIVHMVSASVAGLSPDQVTVIDQHGNLLTDGRGGPDELVLSAKRFDYTHKLEQSYIERVEAILAPLVGPDGVRAQVTADIDFTNSEQTRESFNPDLPAVRSETTLEEEHAGDAGGTGVPGALSNQPPGPATAPEQTAAAATPTPGAATVPTPAPKAATSNKRNQSTRNYELDRTISHTKAAVGSVRRLSVAVVVRSPAAATTVDQAADKTADKTEAAKTGAAATTSIAAAAASKGLSDAEIERMTNLVKEAIGFDATRGDSVSITSAEFLAPPVPEPLPEPAFWRQPWVWSVGKQVVGGLLALFILFGVIRPTVKSLMSRPLPATGSSELATVGGTALAANSGLMALPGGHAGTGRAPLAALPSSQPRPGSGPLLVSSDIDPNIDTVKQFVTNDPRVAAQVIKGWVGE